MKGFSGVSGQEDFVFADNASFDGTQRGGGLDTNGELWIGSTILPHVKVGTLTSPDNSISFGYSSPNITATAGTAMGTLKTITPNEDFDGTAATPISGTSGNINAVGVNPSFATVTETLNSTGVATGNLQVEHRAWVSGLVVDTSTTPGTRGTYATLAAALAAATSGQTVFMRTSVTENVTLPAGVNIAAWTGSTLNTPTIIGTITMTAAGTSTISGIRLQTNSAALLAVTGSAASIVNLNNCYLNCTNNTGITFSTSSSSARINLTNCDGDLGTTGIAYFTHTSAGSITIRYGSYLNSGASTAASTCSSGVIDIFYCRFSNALTTSSTASSTCQYVEFNLGGFNTTAATLGGSGVHQMRYCRFSSGTASAVSIGSATPILEFCDISSSNTNAITGAGTITGNSLSFSSSSSGVNTTTQTPLTFGIQGTWTPNIQINGSSTGITYTTQIGTYTRIGNLVFISAQVVLSSKGASVGSVTISNLPVATGTSGVQQSIPVGWFTQVTAAGYTTLGLQFGTSSASSSLILSSASGSGILALANTHISDTFNFRAAGVYQII